MQVRIKLMGGLKAKSPAGNTLDLPDGATIEDVLRLLDVPATHVQTVIVNEKLQFDRTRVLTADDELTILPPVGGG